MNHKNEKALDSLIICPSCHTLHEEVPIKDGTKALCTQCESVLYRYDSKLADYGLAWSITGLIFFTLANLFPLVKIDLLGHEQFLTTPQTFVALFDNGFYVVGLLCAFLIFVFPLMLFVLNISIFTLFKLKKSPHASKALLVLLSRIKPWSMSDIFLISILVALVKLIGYAQIHIGVAFWALVVFVLIDLYVAKTIKTSEIWMLRRRLYPPKNAHENI